ncbi:MAG: hypothetical protein ACYSU7_05050 [Planctomycetota bacterium]|jgi:hypothetical protein
MAALNLYFGWSWMLTGMVSGAVLGLFFHKQEWLGGYGSWRRRMVRLAHVAFFGTGLLNLGFALSWNRLTPAGDPHPLLTAASILLVVGAVAMPAVCYASAWRDGFRHLFFVPVVSLMGGVAALLAAGLIP